MAAGNKILEGLNLALAHAGGTDVGAHQFTYRVPKAIDVKALRSKLGLTQAQFALQFGFKVETVRNWEQEKRFPEASARVLLRIIESEPAAVQRALDIAL